MKSRIRLLIMILTAVAPWAARAAVPPSPPLASAETNWQGVSIALASVERKGSVLTVKWVVQNAGPQDVEVHFPVAGDAISTYALDEENGTKYYVLTDKEGHAVASQSDYTGSGSFGIDEKIPAGESRRYWMKLPAPPPAVHSLTLFFTKTEPFEEVPITDR